MTAMRSQMKRTTDRSWAMNRYVSPRAFCSSESRLSTCARMDTSSAEMGSSAMMKSGSITSARAMPMRCRWPPGKLVRETAGNSGQQTNRLQSLFYARLALGLGEVEAVGVEAFGDDVIHLGALVERGHGILKDHLDAPRHLMVEGTGDAAIDLLAVEGHRTGGGGWMRMMARPMVVLPEPDSPTSPNVSPSRCGRRRR